MAFISRIKFPEKPVLKMTMTKITAYMGALHHPMHTHLGYSEHLK